MTPGRAFAYLALWALLTVYFVIFEREPNPELEVAPPQVPLLSVTADEVMTVELRKGPRRVLCRRGDEGWQVVSPPGTSAPTDLIAALVSNLVEGKPVEVLSGDLGSAADFGLDRARASITIGCADGPTMTLSLGSRNPSRTAVYARWGDAPEILLIGLNIEYYHQLIMEAASGT